MTGISAQKIDELCELYESQLTSNVCGLESIRSFLNQRDAMHRSARELVINLVQIEIERSWMAWSKNLQKNWTSYKPEEVRGGLLAVPRIESYSPILGSITDRKENFAELALTESMCRDQWGDAIGPVHYQHYFGVCVPASSTAYSKQARCVFDDLSRPSQVFLLRGLNQFGRQRSKDVAPCFIEENPDGNRIVIAHRLEDEISRMHFSVLLLDPAFALIKNESRINDIQIAFQGNLATECSQILKFPFAIKLPGRTLHFTSKS
jgi:hypothetical protein